MLANLGISINNQAAGSSNSQSTLSNIQLKNVAAVMVTAALPPFARPGEAIDVTVSSLGNAKSLRGGTLLLTPLKGADGQVYAIGQGNLVVGGAGASANGSKVQVNKLAAGRISGGAIVERAVPTPCRKRRHDAARTERHGLRHHAAGRRGGEQRVRQRHGHRRSTAARSSCARRPIRSSRSSSWRNCRTSTSSRRKPPRR